MKGIEDYVGQFVRILARCKQPRELAGSLMESARRVGRASFNYLAGFRDPRMKALPGHMVALTTASRMAVIFIALVVPAWLLEVVDPFGLSDVVDGHSQKIVQQIAAPFYPPAAQSRVAVVLIDEASMASRGESWPPRYLYYEEVVRRVAKQRPAAIFLDVLIEDHRTYDASLPLAQKALAETLEDTGVPLYLAVLDDGGRNLFANVPGTRLAMAGWSGYGADYPLTVGRDHWFGKSPPDDDGPCEEDGLPTAAFALYRHLCTSESCAAESNPSKQGGFCAPMVVQWGYTVAPEVRSRDLLSESQCAATEGGTGSRLLDSARILWANFLTSFDPDARAKGRQLCPYTLTIREEDLGTSRSQGVLKDRLVLIGTSLAGIHDVVESPMHGVVPGVYLHAMALDNLLSWDDRYFARAESTPVLLILGLVLAWVSAALIQANPARLDFLLKAFAAGLVIGVSVFSYLILRRPPLDWLGLLLIFELTRRILDASATPHTHPHVKEERQ